LIATIPVERIRVVLADDHPAMISRIRTILDEEFEVIEDVENGDKL
jgi:DNA-binding NarL/FixJ family response regulator